MSFLCRIFYTIILTSLFYISQSQAMSVRYIDVPHDLLTPEMFSGEYSAGAVVLFNETGAPFSFSLADISNRVGVPENAFIVLNPEVSSIAYLNTPKPSRTASRSDNNGHSILDLASFSLDINEFHPAAVYRVRLTDFDGNRRGVQDEMGHAAWRLSFHELFPTDPMHPHVVTKYRRK